MLQINSRFLSHIARQHCHICIKSNIIQVMKGLQKFPEVLPCKQILKEKLYHFGFLSGCLALQGSCAGILRTSGSITFVYAKIAKDPTIISWMLAISAAATTISTFLFGCISDRKGNRKTLISVGYILWGIFTILFGATEFLNHKAGEQSAIIAVANKKHFNHFKNPSCKGTICRDMPRFALGADQAHTIQTYRPKWHIVANAGK